MLIDCHIHPPSVRNIDDSAFHEEVRRAREGGVGCWMVMGTTPENSRAVLEMVDGLQDFYACVGVHPGRADHYADGVLDQLADLAGASPKVVGIGEIGLDYPISKHDPDLQRKAFREQIGLARELKLPLNLHTYGKSAASEMVEVLQQERAFEVVGVLHNFMGSEEMARRMVDMGFYVSVSVVLMHPQADRLRGVYRAVPLGYLVLDTDWPAALVERTGPGDYPFDMDVETKLLNLRRLADRLADEKQVSVQQVMDVTTMNALRAYPKMAAAIPSVGQDQRSL